MGQFPNDEMPQHLVKLARENTSPIEQQLKSFKGTIWLAFLRGKQSHESELKAKLDKAKSMLTDEQLMRLEE